MRPTPGPTQHRVIVMYTPFVFSRLCSFPNCQRGKSGTFFEIFFRLFALVDPQSFPYYKFGLNGMVGLGWPLTVELGQV